MTTTDSHKAELARICDMLCVHTDPDECGRTKCGCMMASAEEAVAQLLWERDQLRAEVAKLKGPPHGVCDACGFPNNADGTCSRAQCYNSD